MITLKVKLFDKHQLRILQIVPAHVETTARLLQTIVHQDLEIEEAKHSSCSRARHDTLGAFHSQTDANAGTMHAAWLTLKKRVAAQCSTSQLSHGFRE